MIKRILQFFGRLLARFLDWILETFEGIDLIWEEYGDDVLIFLKIVAIIIVVLVIIGFGGALLDSRNDKIAGRTGRAEKQRPMSLEERVFHIFYICLDRLLHKSSRQREREPEIIRMVRSLLFLSRTKDLPILREYRIYKEQTVTASEIDRLSLSYRRALFVCALRAAHKDLKTKSKEAPDLHAFAKEMELAEETAFQRLANTDLDGDGVIKMLMLSPHDNLCDWACKILGVDVGASPKQIKEAFQAKTASISCSDGKSRDEQPQSIVIKEANEALVILQKREELQE